jgi:4-amino-4-deoxy-L-arabinose transferase-like glycosyltransferase
MLGAQRVLLLDLDLLLMPALDSPLKRTLFAAVLTCTAILGLRLALAAAIPLTDNTESRYAEVSRLILEYSDWITLHYDSETPFLGKPPLAFWLSAIGIDWFGANAFGPRLPILTAAVMAVFLLYRFVAGNADQELAARSTLVLSGSFFFFVNSGVVQTDFVLAFCCLWAMIAFWQYAGNQGSRLAAGNLGLALGFGFLAKGLAIAVFAGLPIFVWLLVSGLWRGLLRQTAWLWGGFAGLLVVLPWLVAAELKTPGFLHYFFIGEHFQRLLEPGWSGDRFGTPRSQPPGTIILFCLAGMLPWTFYLLKLARPADRQAVVARLREYQTFFLYLSVWSGIPMLAMVLVPNYIFPYVIPISIPLSVLVTAALLSDTPLGRVVLVSLSLPLILFAATLFVASSPQVDRYTQENIVRAFQERCAERQCQLLFTDNLKFSGDYYSRKMAQQVDVEDLAQTLSDQTHDFIVTPAKLEGRIPVEIRAKFDAVGRFHRMLLLEERRI